MLFHLLSLAIHDLFSSEQFKERERERVNLNITHTQTFKLKSKRRTNPIYNLLDINCLCV